MTMDNSTYVREQVFQKLFGYKYQGVEIPIFDEIVNPNIIIPSIGDAQEVYIIFQDQQEQMHAIQTVCDPRFNLSFTLRVVTTWGRTGTKSVSEEIGFDLLNLLRDKRGTSLIPGIQKIELVSARSLFEHTDAKISFVKVIILNFIKNG